MSGEKDPVLDGISDSLRMEDWTPMVVSYVVVAEFIDHNGEKQIFTDTYEDQRRVTTLGLIEWMGAIQRGRIMESDRSDD